MTTINTFFDKVYCLTIQKNNKTRLTEVKKRFMENDISVNVVDGVIVDDIQNEYNLITSTPKIPIASYAILHSFLKIFEDIRDNNIKHALIFEDDVLFCKNFKELFDKQVSVLPNDWDFWYLGCTEFYGTRVYNDGYIPYSINDHNDNKINRFFKKLEIAGNFAIAVNSTIVDAYIQKLKQSIEQCNIGADGIIFNYLDSEYNVYISDPVICAHEYGYSDADNNSFTKEYCIKNHYYYRLYNEHNFHSIEKNIKVHLCCGDVYLYDYINVDVNGRLLIHGELNLNLTTTDDYYKDREIGNKRETIVDKHNKILETWEYENNSVEEIVLICALEHFTKEEAEFIISEAHRVLKIGGKFKIDIPDIKKTIEEYYDTDPDYCMTLVYCNHKNKYSVHHFGYSEKSLANLLGDGWSLDFQEIVKHDYPVIGCVATKQ